MKPGSTAKFGLKSPARMLVMLIPLVATVWACWPSVATMVHRWSSDPRYSFGFVVPVFAAWLWWSRRGLAAGERIDPNPWGLAWVSAGAVMKVLAVRNHLGWVDAIALLPILAGVALIAGGRRTLVTAWPSLIFLAFMVPLPYRWEVALGAPMQRLACTASTYMLQTCGISATSEGNIIDIDNTRINVAEACNGMGMLFMFLAFSTGVALVSSRPLADRIAIVVTAPAVAMVANIARIVATGVLFCYAGDEAAERLYHDLAGWVMMPLALAALALELWILSLLFVDSGPSSDLPGVLPRPRVAGMVRLERGT